MSIGTTVSVKVDLSGIARKLSDASIKKGKLAMSHQALLDMERYVPRKDGNLRGGAQVTDEGVKYPGPYGRAHFYGGNGIMNFHVYSEPGTGKRWDLRVTDKYQEWGKIALRAMGIRA